MVSSPEVRLFWVVLTSSGAPFKRQSRGQSLEAANRCDPAGLEGGASIVVNCLGGGAASRSCEDLNSANNPNECGKGSGPLSELPACWHLVMLCTEGPATVHPDSYPSKL